MRAFWPAGEAAQADYETLRTAALRGEVPDSLMAARFARRGVAGLLAWPAVGAGLRRPGARRRSAAVESWGRPRLDALAAGYELLVAVPVTVADLMEVAR